MVKQFEILLSIHGKLFSNKNGNLILESVVIY